MQKQKWERLHKDEAEFAKCEQDPLYFYNNYVRKEGEPELGQEEFDDYVRKEQQKRDRIGNKFPSLVDRVGYWSFKYNEIVAKTDELIDKQLKELRDATTGTSQSY